LEGREGFFCEAENGPVSTSKQIEEPFLCSSGGKRRGERPLHLFTMRLIF
jgi:hypothetical protein